MKPTIPPTLRSNTFLEAGRDVGGGLKIYVPAENVDTYKNTIKMGWTTELKNKVVAEP